MGTPYSTVAVSGYNSSPPSDDGTQVDSNKVYWSTAKTKLGDPLNTAIAAIDTALVAAFNYTASEKTADYTTVAGDAGKIIEIGSTVSSAVTITLGQVASMGTSYIVKVVNRSTISQTIVRGGSDTINGSLTSITIPSKASLTFQVNASNNGYDVIAAVGYMPGTLTVDGTTTLTGVATLTAQPVLSSLTASQAVFTDGSKGLVSNAITGSGNVVMSTSPTFATSVIGSATMAVFNSASTTVNAFGAATTLNIGNSGGTNTILGVSNFSQGVNGTIGSGTPAAGAFTTLGASGTITSTTTGFPWLTSSSTGTGRNYQLVSNTGGGYTLGVESSAGGTQLVADTAYSTVLTTTGATDLFLGTNATARLKIDGSTGLATFNNSLAVTGTGSVTTGFAVGGATPGTGGVAFPATAVAVANANTLDDYEEGTWTIGVSFGGGTTGITSSTAQGTYTKVGDTVFVSGYIILTSKGSSTGSVLITGLPFTVSNNSDSYFAASTWLTDVTFTGQTQSVALRNSTTGGLYQITEAGTRSDLTDTNFANTSQVIFTCSYRV